MTTMTFSASLETCSNARPTAAAAVVGRALGAAPQACAPAAGSGGGCSARGRRWLQHWRAWQAGRRGGPRSSTGSDCESCRQRWHSAAAAPRLRRLTAAGAAPAGGPGPAGQQQGETLADVMNSIVAQLAEMQAQQAGGGQRPGAAHLHVGGLSYQPPGAPSPLLTDVSMTLPPNQLGLVFGRSGAGKTTLLQLIGGLAQPGGGSISFSGPPRAAAGAAAGTAGAAVPATAAAGCSMSAEQRMAQAGLVFQFPERHFIGRTMSGELTVGWPTAPEQLLLRSQLAQRTHSVLDAVGLSALPLDVPLAHLSDGYKRRVALAVQLVRRPRLLLLDEPLAGLDWRTRGELVSLLAGLKAECTVLVVSHDLRELAPLVDAAWEMLPGGRLTPADVAALPSLG